MDVMDGFFLVLLALLLLLAAGGMAAQVEKLGYYLASSEAAAKGDRTHIEVEARHSELRREQERLMALVKQQAEHIDGLEKERASLLGQERSMADMQANFVAEAGYPQPGAEGHYFLLEGPAKDMPFAGLASHASAFSSRRRVRLVVWGLGPVEAQKFAAGWGGEQARMIAQRPFTGRLFWHEL